MSLGNLCLQIILKEIIRHQVERLMTKGSQLKEAEVLIDLHAMTTSMIWILSSHSDTLQDNMDALIVNHQGTQPMLIMLIKFNKNSTPNQHQAEKV